MNTTAHFRLISTGSIVASLLFASAIGLGKPQRNPKVSNQENPGILLTTAMKNMERGVWSVSGTVTLEKTIKLHGLLSGEDYDLTMEPRGMRGVVIKDKAWVCSDRETWHAGSPNDRLPYDWVHTDHGRRSTQDAV